MDDLTERFRLMQMQKALQARGERKIKLRWSSPAEVRRSLARVNNMLLNGELPAKDANAIYFSANLILQALEAERKEADAGGD